MKLSKRKRDALYDCVYDEIMRARIKIAILLREVKPQGEEVENILSDLTITAPGKALKVFEQ
ncbi:MAG: hypothetical protein OHK0019_00590 [Saprospiraceae bacterium]